LRSKKHTTHRKMFRRTVVALDRLLEESEESMIMDPALYTADSSLVRESAYGEWLVRKIERSVKERGFYPELKGRITGRIFEDAARGWIREQHPNKDVFFDRTIDFFRAMHRRKVIHSGVGQRGINGTWVLDALIIDRSGEGPVIERIYEASMQYEMDHFNRKRISFRYCQEDLPDLLKRTELHFLHPEEAFQANNARPSGHHGTEDL